MFCESIRTDEAMFALPGMPSAEAAEEIKRYAQGLIDQALEAYDGTGNRLGHILVALDQHGFILTLKPDYHHMAYPEPGRPGFGMMFRIDSPAGNRVLTLRGDIPVAVANAVKAGASPLKAWRDHRGITLRNLAETTGIPHTTLQQHERSAHPRAATLDTWGLALHVDRSLLEKTYALRG